MLGIKDIDVRFFAYGYIYTTAGTIDTIDIIEVEESVFTNLEGDITYERDTIFENGCRQICITRCNHGNPIELNRRNKHNEQIINDCLDDIDTLSYWEIVEILADNSISREEFSAAFDKEFGS